MTASNAIRDTTHDGALMGSQIVQNLAQFLQTNIPVMEFEELSAREREVLEFLAKGYLIKEIGGQLAISFDTVRTYIRRIYEKMQVHSRSQAVAKYLRLHQCHTSITQLNGMTPFLKQFGS